MLLRSLHGDVSDLEMVILDINCQFEKHYRSVFPDEKQLQFWIGWLHSKAGHNISCKLEKGAMFANNTGRCIGEAVENLWVSADPRILPLLG